MSPLPTLPILVDAFLADTAHMTVEEVGAHIRLLMFAWRSPGCCLPADDVRLARMLGLSAKKWAAIKPAVLALWNNSQGNYTHNRLTHERQFVTTKLERKRAAGKLGGRPKSLQLQEQGEQLGSVIEKQTESEPKAPTPTPTPTPTLNPIIPSGIEPDGFAEFRSIYPARNVAFPTTLARKRWQQAIKQGAKPSEINAGAKAYAAEQQRIGKVGTEFVKTADTWLNQGRWKDYAPQPEAPPPTPIAVPDETWRQRVRTWRSRGGDWPWRPVWPPDDPRTTVPNHILAEFGLGNERFAERPAIAAGGRR